MATPAFEKSKNKKRIFELLGKVNRKDFTFKKCRITIKKELGEDYNEKTLQYWRSKFLTPEQRLPPKVAQVRMKKLDETVDVYKESIRLFNMQKARVEKEVEAENQCQRLLPSVREEIKVAGVLLEGIKNLEFELGIKEKKTNNGVAGDLNYYILDTMEKVKAAKKEIDAEDKKLGSRTRIS